MFENLYYCIYSVTRYHACFIASVGYLTYYLVKAVKRPLLAIQSGPFQDYLLRKVGTIQAKYWPTFWCIESRAQTIFASFLRSKVLPNINYNREIFVLNDGGQVALDWLKTNCDNENTPTVIILPGLTGESQAEYIKCLVLAANENGLRCCVFNNRGLGGIDLLTPRLYCAANFEDLSEVLNHVNKKYPKSPKGVTGISMGGLILGNYLSHYAEEARKIITAAKIISVPWNIEKGTQSIERPFLNRWMCNHLCDALCKTVEKYDILFNGKDEWKEKVLKSRTIREFDDNFTSVHFGFQNVDHYYERATLHNKLHMIKVPTLCLSAADDPFQPFDAIPVNAAMESSHVAILITVRGGHIGFLDGFFPGHKNQYMARIFAEYFSAVLHDVDKEFISTVSKISDSIKDK
ncbi:hypothetical protein ACKWTF_002420 [Chironomus riparius]